MSMLCSVLTVSSSLLRSAMRALRARASSSLRWPPARAILCSISCCHKQTAVARHNVIMDASHGHAKGALQYSLRC